MLHKVKNRKQEGFTIIEVLIVLAIAGLILLIVFLAVPALQRNSRNTQRKNDVASLTGAINEFVSNNSGKAPTAAQATGTGAAVANAKLGYYTTSGNIFGATSGTPATAAATSGSASLTNVTTDSISIWIGYNCTDNVVTATGASARNVVVQYAVESGGSPVIQCSQS